MGVQSPALGPSLLKVLPTGPWQRPAWGSLPLATVVPSYDVAPKGEKGSRTWDWTAFMALHAGGKSVGFSEWVLNPTSGWLFSFRMPVFTEAPAVLCARLPAPLRVARMLFPPLGMCLRRAGPSSPSASS